MSRLSEMQYAAAMFGASNRVIADDTGMGSFYVAVPKMTNAQLMEGGGNNTHPAFIVGDKTVDEILIGKYPAYVKNNRAYSLPGVTPTGWINFDQSVAFCKNKGKGHHLITNAERSMLALWCKKNGTMPRGNSNYGCSSDKPSEIEIPASRHPDNDCVLETKTGPSYPAWYHNADLSGISDLGGNVSDWCGGLRLMNGKIQVLPNNNAALDTADMSSDSTQWKEISASDGSYVAPGTTGTLGYDWINKKITLTANSIIDVTDNTRLNEWEIIALDGGIGTVPQIARSLCLYKNDSGYNNDAIWVNGNGERLVQRGGTANIYIGAGVFTACFAYTRDYRMNCTVCRAAYVSL